jgi:hypothetical protein
MRIFRKKKTRKKRISERRRAVLFVNPTWFVPAVAPVEMPTGLPLMRLASVLMSSNASMGGLRQRPWAHRPRRTLTCGASTGPSSVTRPAPLLAGCAYAYLGSSRTAALRRQRTRNIQPANDHCGTHATRCGNRFDRGARAGRVSRQLSGGADQPIWMLRACVIHHETRNSRIYSRTGFHAACGNKRVEPTVIQVTAIDSTVKEDETWTA